MFSSQRFQILDLGSFALKAVIASVGRDGRPSIESARTVPVVAHGPGLEAYLAALTPALVTLAAGFFRRGQPVHFIPPEALVRGAVHRLPAVTDLAVPEILRTSRAAFVGSFGTRAPIHDRSFALQVAREDEMVRVTAVHAFARREDVALLRQCISEAGLKPGAVIAPLLALAELAAALGAVQGEDAARVLVEVGAGTTSVFLLDESNALSFGRVFGGSDDAFRRLAEEVPDLTIESVLKLREAFAAKGRDALESAGVELGLEGGLAAQIADRAAGVGERILTATFHAIAKLGPRSHEEEGGETTQAVQIPGAIAFTGGGAELPGLCESASSRFDVACVVADPCSLLGLAKPARLDFGPGYAAAMGGLSALARIGAEAANLAEEPAASAAPGAPEEGLTAAWAVRPLISGALLSGLVLAGFAAAGQVLEGHVSELERDLERDRAALPPPQEVQKLLTSFRDLRAREVAVDARFAYVGELFRGRVSWPRLLADLDRGITGTKCLVENVDVQVAWPNAADTGRGTRARQRWVWATLKGQAPSLPAVTQAVQALRGTGVVKEPRPKTSTGNKGSAFDQKAPSIKFEISGDLEYGPIDR